MPACRVLVQSGLHSKAGRPVTCSSGGKSAVDGLVDHPLPFNMLDLRKKAQDHGNVLFFFFFARTFPSARGVPVSGQWERWWLG